jgi:hypothetical protein
MSSDADIIRIAQHASTLVALSFNLRFHADYARAQSMVVPYSVIPRSDEAFFVLRFMQRRMKIGYTAMTDAGYAFFKRIPDSASVIIPRLTDDVYATCRAIVFTLSNAPRALQTESVARAILGANDATIKQARFLVRLYCSRADLTVGQRVSTEAGEEGEEHEVEGAEA